MTNVQSTVFNNFYNKKKYMGKSITLPISFAFHIVILAYLALSPFLDTVGNMPRPKKMLVRLISMPGLSIPGIRVSTKRKRKVSGRSTKRIQPEQYKNIAPLTIPEEIIEQDILPDLNSGENTDGGIDPDLFDNLEIGNGFIGNGKYSEGFPVSIIKSPKLLRKVAPVYPPLALKARVSGKIVIEAVTDIYGKVVKIRIISGKPLLNNAAENAVRQWLYEPYIVNGIPHPVKFTVTVTFRLLKQR